MSLLLFDLGGEPYGLELKALQEVADDPPWHFVPGGGAFILGAINLHGRILPVIDLPALLGVPADRHDQRLLVLGTAGHGLALAVSGVGRIVPFQSEELQLPPAGLELPAVAGVIDIEGRRVNLLDAGVVIERLQAQFQAA